MNQTKTFCKVRGITLNYNASQFLNFDVNKDMILNQVISEISFPQPIVGTGMHLITV